MAGIADFLNSLSETEWDSVLMVSQDLQDSTAPKRILSLQNFAKTLREEIDRENRKRDTLGQKVENLNNLLVLLDSEIDHGKQGESVELSLLRDVLLGWRSSLRSEIEALRPDEKLKKRYDTERKRDLLTQLQTTVTSLNRLIMDANPPERVQVACTPNDKAEAR